MNEHTERAKMNIKKKNKIHRMHWDHNNNNMPIDNDNDCSQRSFAIEIKRRDRVYRFFLVLLLSDTISLHSLNNLFSDSLK